MEELINAGADLDVMDVDGWTPLHNAALNGQVSSEYKTVKARFWHL